MPTREEWDAYDKHFLEGLKKIRTQDWQLGLDAFKNAVSLVKTDESAIVFKKRAFVLYLVCLFKLGRGAEVGPEYEKEFGIIDYFNTPPLLPLFVKAAGFLCSPGSSIVADMQKAFASAPRAPNNWYYDNLKEIFQVLKEYADCYKETTKKLPPNIDEKRIGIPSYEELALAAHDTYQRDLTSANITHHLDCRWNNNLPSNIPPLMQHGWELLLTSKQAPLYKPGEYYGKAYIHRQKKIVIVASKGTDNNNKDLEADFELLNRRIPDNYYEQADDFLKKVQETLQRQGVENYPIYLTGHSLGGALSGLLSCKYLLPATTFDSPGIWDLIEYSRRPDVQAQLRIQGKLPHIFAVKNASEAPVTGIVSQNNVVNRANKHEGRLLKLPIPALLIALRDLSKINGGTILLGLLRRAGTATLDTLLQTFISQPTFGTMSSLFNQGYTTYRDLLRTHSMEQLFLDYFVRGYPSRIPFVLQEVTHWPSSLQDHSAPVFHNHRDRCVSLDTFETDMQLILRNASVIAERNDFPNKYQDLKNLFLALEVTDSNSGKALTQDHITIKGLITIDQFRLYFYALMKSLQHKEIQEYLSKSVQEITLPPVHKVAPAVTSVSSPVPSPIRTSAPMGAGASTSNISAMRVPPPNSSIPSSSFPVNQIFRWLGGSSIAIGTLILAIVGVAVWNNKAPIPRPPSLPSVNRPGS